MGSYKGSSVHVENMEGLITNKANSLWVQSEKLSVEKTVRNKELRWRIIHLALLKILSAGIENEWVWFQ